MTANNTPKSFPIHGHDIRHYLERPDGLDCEIHCYRNEGEPGAIKQQIVLRMCFFTGTPPAIAPVYENLPITIYFPLERLAPLQATLQSGAPVELFLEVVRGKLCHRLHSNTIGWIKDGRVATVDSETQ